MIQLFGGPHDGETIAAPPEPDGLKVGDSVAVVGPGRGRAERYRIRTSYVAAGLHIWAAYWVEKPGRYAFAWDSETLSWRPGDLVAAGARMTGAEALMALAVGLSLGGILAAAFGAVGLAGWAVAYTAGRIGGWLNLALVCLGGGALGALAAVWWNPGRIRKAAK